MRQTKTWSTGDGRGRSGWTVGTVVLLGVLASASTPLSGCRTESKVETLPEFAVDLKWDRPGGIALEVGSVGAEAEAEEESLKVSFVPVGVVPLQRIERRFSVVPEVEALPGGARSESPVELERLAQRVIRDHYPQLASNADARVAADSVDVGDVSIAVDGRPTMAKVSLDVRPGEPREVGISQERLPARVVAVRLASRDDAGEALLEALLEAEISTGPDGTDTAVLDLSRLGSGDCTLLRRMIDGDVVLEVLADVERRGRTTSATAAIESPDVAEALRAVAWARLASLAAGASATDLELRVEGGVSALVHGEALPPAAIVNVSDRPVIRLRSLYKVEHGDGITLADRLLDEIDCLCPGERIELPAPQPTDPCLGPLDARNGVRYEVTSTRNREIFSLRAPDEGGFPVGGRSVGVLAILPIAAEERPLIEVEDLGGGGGTDLELVLAYAGESLRVPFPDVPAGGRAGVSIPEALDAEDRRSWNRWLESARGAEGERTVNLEVMEAWRFGCPDAEGARQRLRLP